MIASKLSHPHNPAAVLVNELPERNTHFFFHRAGPVDVTADAKELGSDVVRPSEGREPLWTSAKNCWRDGDRPTFVTVVGHP